MRYGGYIAVVKVEGRGDIQMALPLDSSELLDQPEGGANALNINRFSLISITLLVCVTLFWTML